MVGGRAVSEKNSPLVDRMCRTTGRDDPSHARRARIRTRNDLIVVFFGCVVRQRPYKKGEFSSSPLESGFVVFRAASK